MQRRRMTRGFTLMELLVVIALITLLAGILLPVLALVRQQSQRVVCLSRLQQISTAHRLYMQDWDDRFPSWFSFAPERPAPFGRFRFWTEYFAPYLRSAAVLRDPAAAAPDKDVLKLSDYALATWEQGGWGGGGEDNPYFRWPGPSLTLAEVQRPTETTTLTDGYTSLRPETAVEMRRHHGGLQVSFVDGHARWLSESEFRRVETDGLGFYWWHYGTTDR